MKKRLKHIDPLQLGKVLAALYGCLSLIVVPFILVFSLVASQAGHGSAFPGVLLLIFVPVLYAVLGFVAGVIMAVLYNLLAAFTGGIHFTLEDLPPA